jgi:SAM-dependent methyltransferase
MSLIGQRQSQDSKPSLQIIDVGCGRGWLTNILSNFGEVLGLEPVSSVVMHACRLFPHLQFVVGTPEEYIQTGNAGKYDVAVCSEVIEHVPYESQLGFLAALASLIRSDGNIILTSPRGELYDMWTKTATHPQPIENWLTEDRLDKLAAECGLIVTRRERFFPVSFGDAAIPLLYRRPMRRLFSTIGYSPDHVPHSMMYQIVWLRNPAIP